MKPVYITAQAPYGRGEAFIINEMLAIKEVGVDLLIIPRNPTKEVFHQETRGLLLNTIWLPLISFKMIRIFFVLLITKPRLLRILFLIICNSRTLKILIKNLIVIPKGVFIADLLQEKEINHIHAHWGSTTATMAYVTSCLSDIPWSFTIHRWDIAENNMLREKVKTAKFVRCISGIGGEQTIQIVGSEFADKVKVIHMGVKCEFDIQEKRENNIIKKERFTVVTPANLIPVKGHKYLIDGCSILRNKKNTNFKCYFLGDGPLKDDLRIYVREKDLEEFIKMMGFIPHNKVLEMYSKSQVDIVILPSINTDDGEHEGIPVALMEAMSYGIPVISTSTGGIPELLNGAGIIVPEKDSQKLAEAMLLFLNKPQLMEDFSLKGRKKIETEFNLDRIAKDLLDLMRR